MSRIPKSAAGAIVALLFLASCGSVGDILGGGSGNPGTSTSEIRGVVDYVDTANRSITLRNVSGGTSSMLSSGGGDTTRVYFDDRTRVTYQGQTYRPEDLERGDQVAVRVQQSSGSLVANEVEVIQNVRNSSGGGTVGGGYTSTMRGTVNYVDSGRRIIELNRSGYGTSTIAVEYGSSTPVLYGGRTYGIADLERGDEVDIRVRDLGNGRYVADEITVIRSVNSGTNSSFSTVRGTVRYIDTSRRTIELEQTSWVNGFTTGAPSGNTIVIQYDTNVGVEYQGQMHPVNGLERGDVVEVQMTSLGGSNYRASRIYLVRNVRQ